jgi:cell division septum initiation protein DivIVA
MDILYLVDRLENLIASSRRVPLTNQVMIKESDMLNLIDQMRISIPEEIKQARRVIQDKERILAQAQADASLLLTKSREESERVMNREGLLRAAEERSQVLVQEANEQAQNVVRRAEEQVDRLKTDADGYVMETLRNLKEHLLSVETEVGRTIFSIEKGLDSLQGQQETAAHREEIEEDREDAELQPPMRVMPRSSSLAADTIGRPHHLS